MNEKIIWGIHAGRTAEAEPLFLKKDVIALGWPQLGDLGKYKTREEFKEHYAEYFPDASTQSVRNSAGQLFRFVREIAVGDLVVFPGKVDREIHIGEILEEYQYRPDVNQEYANQHAVKWLIHLPRTRFSQVALQEIGAAMSLFQIKNNADEIIAALEGQESETFSAADDVIPDASETEEQTRDFVLKQLDRNLKGLPLEGFIQQLLETMGYRARLTDPNEPSVDLIAHRDELGFEPPIIKVQVKSGGGKIGDKDVSALSGKVETDEFGLFVALSEFTPKARQFASSKSNLRLIDGGELVDLIFEHYEEFDPKYKGIIPLKRIYVPQDLEG